MSVGATRFTSSGSNGSCWLVCMFLPPFLWKKKGFFSISDLRQKKKFTRLTIKKCLSKKTTTYAKKKGTRFSPKKKANCAYFRNQPMLSSCR